MSPAAYSAQLFLLASVAFLAIGSLSSAVLVALLRERISLWEPHARHRVIVLLAALPWLTALTLLSAASMPSFIALIVPAFDHCALHDDGHSHLCFVHLPKVGIHVGLTVGLVSLVTYALVGALLGASRVARALRVVGALAKTGEERQDLGITLVETTQPVCLAAGFLKPRVLVSRGLFNALATEERAIILAHERAHVRRRDAFVASVVRAFSVVHLPGVGSWLVHEVEVAAEQICDEEAALAVADRMAVAAAILSVERAAQHERTSRLDGVAVAFGARAVERRVEALLAEPLPRKSLSPLWLLLMVVLAAVFVFGDEVHHLTESLLSLVAR